MVWRKHVHGTKNVKSHRDDYNEKQIYLTVGEVHAVFSMIVLLIVP